MKPTREQRAALMARRDDGEHAARDVTCPRCHDRRQFWAWVSPDPEGRAEARVAGMASAWLAVHPCVQTFATSARKMRAA